MNDLDAAIREALMFDESHAPDPPSTWTGPTVGVGQRSRRPRHWVAVAALLVLVVGAAAVVARSASSRHRIVPAAPTPTTAVSQEERNRAAAIDAEQKRRLAAAAAAADARFAKLAADDGFVSAVDAAVNELGWQITLPSDLVSQHSTDEAQGVHYFEMRLRDSDIGELVVSIRRGDFDALAAQVEGETRQRGPMVPSPWIIYGGIDTPQARSLELFNGTAIIYVRSESPTGDARPTADLTKLAQALHRRQ